MNAAEAQSYGLIGEVMGDLNNIIEIESVGFKVKTLGRDNKMN